MSRTPAAGQGGWAAPKVIKTASLVVGALFAICAASAFVALEPVASQQHSFESSASLCSSGVVPENVVKLLSQQQGVAFSQCACAEQTVNNTEVSLVFQTPSTRTFYVLSWFVNSKRTEKDTQLAIELSFESVDTSRNGSLYRSSPASFQASCNAISGSHAVINDLVSSSATVAIALPGVPHSETGLSAGAWLCEATSQATPLDDSALSLWDALEAPACVTHRRVLDVLVDAGTLAVSLLGTYLSVVKREHTTLKRSRAARTARAQAIDRGTSRYVRAVGQLRSKPALLFALAMLLGNTVLGGLTFGKLLLLPGACAPASHTAQWNEWISIGSSSALLTPLVGIGLGLAALPAHFNDGDLLSKASGAVGGGLAGVVGIMLLPHLVMGAVLFVGIWLFNALLLLLGLLLLTALIAALAVALRAAWQTCRRRKAALQPPAQNTNTNTSRHNATAEGGLPLWALFQRILLGLTTMSLLVWVAALPQMAAVVLRFGAEDSLCTDTGGSISAAYEEAFPWDYAEEVFPEAPFDQLFSVNVGLAAVFMTLSQNSHTVVAVSVAIFIAVVACWARRKGGAGATEGGGDAASPSVDEEAPSIQPAATQPVLVEDVLLQSRDEGTVTAPELPPADKDEGAVSDGSGDEAAAPDGEGEGSGEEAAAPDGEGDGSGDEAAARE